MKKNIARRKTLKITAMYFFIGCAWIYVSDIIVQFYFSELSQVLFYSILKGVSYVFVTAALIFCLTYPALKEVLDSKESIKKVNSELEKTNELYLELYHDYRKKQALLKSLIDSIPDLIFYKDVNSVYMGCNAAFEQFVGRLERDIVGHTDKDLFSQEQADRFMNIDKKILEDNTIVRFEERFSNPDGKEVVFETLKTPYYDNDGKIIGLIGISRDITERKIREERIQYISHHDTLTGLYNRTYFDEAKIALDRPDQLPLSVIVGDINGMKMINDTFGHKKGDTLLKEVANILKQCVQKNHVVARTGGDEFMILMPHTDGQAVKEIADRIRATAKEKRLEETLDFYMDIALGYATKNEPSESLDKAILLAEDYMYRRKLLEERSLHNDYLTYIKMTMFEKSNETEKHAERLVELSLKLGEALGLSEV